MLSRFSVSGDITKISVSADAATSLEFEQIVPGWTAFNALANKGSVPNRFTIAYCPVINASPTDMATAYAVLWKCLDRSSKAGQDFCKFVVDQAIYAKATAIISQRQQ